MNRIILLLLTLLPLAAQSQELGLLLGTLRGNDNPALGSGMALQANYAFRFAAPGPVQLFAGVNFIANPQRLVTPSSPNGIRDLASLYLTPELKLKFGRGRIQPYTFIGAGLAVYEHSTLTAGGAPNPGPRTSNTGTLTYGAGADLKVFKRLSLRGELRDNYSGAPTYNVPAGNQHNTSLTGGFVLHWGR
jgi:opacity protein-like surface antigen